MMTQPMPTISTRVAPPPQRWWEVASDMTESPARLAESGDVADIPDAFWLPIRGSSITLQAGAARSTLATHEREHSNLREKAGVIAAYAALGSSAAVTLFLLTDYLAHAAS